MSVPIQAVVALCTAFLGIIGGLILWYLTKLLGEVKDLRGDFKTLEDKKMSKETFEAELKAINAKLERLPNLETKMDTLIQGQFNLTLEVTRHFVKEKQAV